MKKSLLLILTLGMSQWVVAQCTTTVSNNSVIVDASSQAIISPSNTNFWVCSDAFQKVFMGNNNTIYVEDGAFVSINGSGNTVYHKSANPIVVFGGNNVLFAVGPSAVSDNGTGNTINTCGPNGVVFDYSSAPTVGCTGVGVEENTLAEVQVVMDATGQQLIVNAGTVQLTELRIMDMGGREVANTQRAVNAVNVSHLPVGSYVVHLQTDKGVVVRRFVK